MNKTKRVGNKEDVDNLQGSIEKNNSDYNKTVDSQGVSKSK
jgi:hypothetical protein